jgi:predicted RNA-binding protein YlxR (DUF448 family)
VGCRARRSQVELLRVTRRKDGTVSIDAASARSEGRGAYVCRDDDCLDQAWRSGRLRRALLADGPLPDQMRTELARRIGERRLG